MLRRDFYVSFYRSSSTAGDEVVNCHIIHINIDFVRESVASIAGARARARDKYSSLQMDRNRKGREQTSLRQARATREKMKARQRQRERQRDIGDKKMRVTVLDTER